MAKIYNRLLLAPSEWWESNEVLCVRGKYVEGVSTSAWTELVKWLGVTPKDAHKAMEWMQGKEIISYGSSQKGREMRISFEGLYYPEGSERVTVQVLGGNRD
jgi:hypothetical protein